MKDLRRKNYESGDDSDEVQPTVNININCRIDPKNPSGLSCKIAHDPFSDIDEDIEDAISRARDEDDEDDEVVEKKRKPSKSKPKSKKPSKHEEEDEGDESDDESEGSDYDSEELSDEDEDEDDDTILQCITKSTMKKR
jgi:hypothetical protein